MFAYHTSWLHRISFIPLWLHRFVLPDDVAPNGSRKLCWRMFQWLHSFICLLSFILFTIVNEKMKLQQDRRDKIASKRATLVCTLHIPIFFSFKKSEALKCTICEAGIPRIIFGEVSARWVPRYTSLENGSCAQVSWVPMCRNGATTGPEPIFVEPQMAEILSN